MAANSPSPLAAEARLFGRDIYHVAGGDVQATPGGDLATMTGRDNLREAIHRRLVASPGDLFWAPDYGCGLPDEVKQLMTPTRLGRIKARVTANLLAEDRISRVESVEVTAAADGTAMLTVSVRFVDVASDQARQEAFDF